MTKTDNTRPAGMLGSEQRDGHQSVSDDHFALTIDFTSYDRKPQGKEIAAITRRLQAAGPTKLTIEEFALAVAHGCTWVGGCYQPKSDGWGEFDSIEKFANDFDNEYPVMGKDGKPLKDESGRIITRIAMPYDADYCDPWDMLRLYRDTFGTWPLMMYPTFSYRFDGTFGGRYSKDTRMKFRIVFDFGRTFRDEGEARKQIEKMRRLYPHTDPKCVNPNRLYFGACGKCVWFDRDGGAHYVRA